VTSRIDSKPILFRVAVFTALSKKVRDLLYL
jgi:hypothetical protein